MGANTHVPRWAALPRRVAAARRTAVTAVTRARLCSPCTVTMCRAGAARCRRQPPVGRGQQSAGTTSDGRGCAAPWPQCVSRTHHWERKQRIRGVAVAGRPPCAAAAAACWAGCAAAAWKCVRQLQLAVEVASSAGRRARAVRQGRNVPRTDEGRGKQDHRTGRVVNRSTGGLWWGAQAGCARPTEADGCFSRSATC
jgi:hypothetical protein